MFYFKVSRTGIPEGSAACFELVRCPTSISAAGPTENDHHRLKVEFEGSAKRLAFEEEELPARMAREVALNIKACCAASLLAYVVVD